MKTIIKMSMVAGLLTSALNADFTLEYKMDGNMKQIVQYKDARHVLITTDGGQQGDSGGELIVGDKKFMVMKQNGKTKYMDMDVMMEQMKQFGSMMGSSTEEASGDSVPDFKIVHKGKKKKIAGIDGQVWTIEVNADGKKERIDVVVTDDKDVVDAVSKYAQVMKTFTSMGGKGDDALSSLLNIENGYAAIGFDGMELVKYSDADIPESVFALPAGMNVGEKIKNAQQKNHGVHTVKKPPLCPIVGSHGRAKRFDAMLKESTGGWKKIESAACMDMMKMYMENAIYQKGDAYIHLSLAVNVDGENGMIAKYKLNNMKVSNLQRGKIQGYRYQSGFLERVGQNAMDIKLPNAMLSLTATKNVKDDLATFAKEALDLSKFVPVKKSRPSADDALRSLGAMFGGQGGGNHGGGQAPNNADMQKAGEMLKGLFGN